MTQFAGVCTVCGDALDEDNRSLCANCGRPFHQSWDVTAKVPQCGRVMAHPDALALVFLCQNCYAALQQQEGDV